MSEARHTDQIGLRELLEVDARFLHAQGFERPGHRLHHRLRPAYEYLSIPHIRNESGEHTPIDPPAFVHITRGLG